MNALHRGETFIPKLRKSSFLQKQESSLFNIFWTTTSAGVTMRGYFSKVSWIDPRGICRRGSEGRLPKWIEEAGP